MFTQGQMDVHTLVFSIRRQHASSPTGEGFYARMIVVDTSN